MKIVICIIATNQYKSFVPQLTKSICEYFLLSHEIELHIFTEGIVELYEDERVKHVFHKIPAYKFPEASLYRFHIMTSLNYEADYLYYIDADMQIVDYVGDEILGDIVAVRHPGYFMGGWGSENVNPKSTAYLQNDKRLKYFAGGFQGGKLEHYFGAMLIMAAAIEVDRGNGIMAEWQDESHWNRHLAYNPPTVELNPSYCMPEPEWKRKAWKINNLPVKIIALEKDENIRL